MNVARVGGEVMQFCCIGHFLSRKILIDEESVLQNSVCVLQFRVYVLQNSELVLLYSSTWLYTIYVSRKIVCVYLAK